MSDISTNLIIVNTKQRTGLELTMTDEKVTFHAGDLEYHGATIMSIEEARLVAEMIMAHIEALEELEEEDEQDGW